MTLVETYSEQMRAAPVRRGASFPKTPWISFPESRRKAYYLTAIHEHLPKVPKSELKLMGWTKARELVKVVRSNGREFDCAPWVHKAIDLPREEFKREVEKHLTGQDTEPWEIVYFKVYKSQLPVIEQGWRQRP